MNKVLYIDNKVANLMEFERSFSLKHNISTEQDNSIEYELYTYPTALAALEMSEELYLKKTPIKLFFLDYQNNNDISTSELIKKIKEIDKFTQIVIFNDGNKKNQYKAIEDIENMKHIIFYDKLFTTLELKLLTQDLCEKYDLLSSKENLLNNVGEELKAPLVSLVGFSNLLLENGTLDDQSKLFIKFILKNSNLMTAQVEDLICSIHNGEANIKIHKSYFKAHDFLKRLELFTESLIVDTHKDLSLNIELPKYDFSINADEIRIFQCMVNMITNSLKFTQQGEISISINKENNKIYLKVKDNGIGIEGQYHKVIFEKFKRIATPDYYSSGLGLGLFVCKSIIDKHQGIIDIESSVGLGSEFIITLPQVA